MWRAGPLTRVAAGAVLALAAGCGRNPVALGDGSPPAAEVQSRLASVLSPRPVTACFRPYQPIAPVLDAPDALPGGDAVRVVLAVDSSGSMRKAIGGEPKIEAAKRAAEGFLADLPTGVQAGLVIFGHRGDNKPSGKAVSCSGVETALAPGEGSRAAIAGAVGRLSATGWTPLASAIDQAGALLDAKEAGTQAVWVVSDGVETCGGDPVAAARRLRAGHVRAMVNIIGFDIPPAERAALRAVADAGGGVYRDVGTGADLLRLMTEQRNNMRRLRNQTRAANATGYNQVSAGNLDSYAGLCVGNMISLERQTFANHASLERLTLANQGAPAGQRKRADAILAAAQARLDQRHAAMKAALARYQAAVQGREQTTYEAIQADLRRLEPPPG